MKRNHYPVLMQRPGPLLLSLSLAFCLLPLIPTPAQMNAPASAPVTSAKTNIATFGGGCFWCLEALYQTVPGVISVTSGYAGGQTPNPTYKAVCSGLTGHAEVVQIRFNPDKISYAELLRVFWEIHDPTTLNRQGNDVGTQYRSIILYHDPTQQQTAEQSKVEIAQLFKSPVVTQIVPLAAFYPAENYHQDYFAQHANVPYCQMVIRPKLEKFKQHQQSRSSSQSPK